MRMRRVAAALMAAGMMWAGVAAPAQAADVTVDQVSAIGEVQWCRGPLAVKSGTYVMTTTVSTSTDGSVVTISGTITVLASDPIIVTDSAGASFVMSDIGSGSNYTVTVTNSGYPVGTFESKWAFDSAKGRLGLTNTSTVLKADGSQVDTVKGNCGTPPITAVTSQMVAKQVAKLAS